MLSWKPSYAYNFKAEKGLIWKHDFRETNDATNAEKILFTINSTTVIEIYVFEMSNQPTKIVIFLQNLTQNSGFYVYYLVKVITV